MRKLADGKTEHLLKLRGFGDGDSTWEPKNNLDCGDLIEVFEKVRKEKGRLKHGDKLRFLSSEVSAQEGKEWGR